MLLSCGVEAFDFLKKVNIQFKLEITYVFEILFNLTSNLNDT